MAIFSTPTNGKQRKARKGTSGSVYDKICGIFMSHNNAWMTLGELEKAGVKRPSARTIMYSSHRDDFERESKQGGQRQTKFRLKHPAKAE